MKLRKATPFLLALLTPSLVHSASNPEAGAQVRRLYKRDALDETAEAQRIAAAVLGVRSPGSQAQKPSSHSNQGTEAAPVDGLDGRPRVGPFVDTASGGRGVLKQFAAFVDHGDGVMGSEARVAPEKGTTGTEGGISEMEKLKREAGSSYEPRAAPPVPQAELGLVEESVDHVYTSKSSADVGADGSKSEYSGGLAKPDDLPDRPHDIAHPPPPRRRDGEPEHGWLTDTLPNTEGKTSPLPWRWAYLFRKPVVTTEPPTLKKPSASDDEDESSWHEWFHSFVLSLTMILFSEIGDKTFLVAALMAMRHSQILVFSAAFSALVVMTILSALLGHAFPTILPKRLTTFAAACLFLVFGAKMLREGLAMSSDMGVGEEMKEVEAELEEKEQNMALDRRRRASSVSAYDLESGRVGRRDTQAYNRHQLPNGAGGPSPPISRSPTPSKRPGKLAGLMNLLSLVLSPAWVQTFIMTFLGEWGDRSQIATIAMAAGQDYWWVTLGAISGHAVCTGLAVVGGRALAGKVSLRVVTIGGAAAFLVFGVIYLFECIYD